jgi:ankyrin repeat protein
MPLMLAATNGSEPMIAALLKAGANVNAALPNGQTALMTAARTGGLAAVNALLSAGASVEAVHVAKGQTALMWSIAQQHADVTRVLIEHGAKIDAHSASGFTPLLFAAREGDVETTQLLLTKGVDINESSQEGATPLMVATARGHVDLALFLLDRGASPDGNARVLGYTPLHWAVMTFENNPIVYANVRPIGEWDAISGIPDRSKKIALINSLLAHGAKVDALTTKPLLFQAPPPGGALTFVPGPGLTPFFMAAASADAEVMRLLVASGADPSVKSPSGQTALMVATSADIDISARLTEPKRLEAVRLAWELGNDLEAAESGGHRAMHFAARGGFHSIITFLVEHGADLNPLTKPRQDFRGGLVPPQTPLAITEGSVYVFFVARPATAEFLRKLGGRSEGKYEPDRAAKATNVAAAGTKEQ